MEATRENVVAELMDESVPLNADGSKRELVHIRTREQAEAMVDRHATILERGAEEGITAYYVAVEILKAEDKLPQPKPAWM